MITLVLSTSCSSATPENQSPLSTFPVVPDKTPTISALPPTAIPTILPTDSTGQCLGFQQNLPLNLEGEIVLSGKNSLYQPTLKLHETPPYILVPATGDRLLLSQASGDDVKDFSVSPDKKWLTYYAQQSGRVGNVYIVGNDGSLFKNIRRAIGGMC